ncbi:thiamine ABC transporter ATP-binding protein [Yoonia sp. 2307UL14-13]|uniref:thiamine ABC transporter ATP-binding protein n=1 Tax=Yoonia sp. 2307UL14-13 TaxID=3126506 RepID=UPI0030B74D46
MLQCKALVLEQGNFKLSMDLAFVPQVITALVGPSGAGKSTLLAALAGFLAPAEGRILYEDKDLTQLSPGSRPISILFQDHNLFPHLTIAQNVGLAIAPRLRLGVADQARVSEVLTRVGLEGMESRRPAALSGGQQSRAALARVLLADRPVVLLDEPFAALGPALRRDMLDLVKDTLTGAGRTVIMVTHDPADARRVADETVLVADGRAAPPLATETLFATPPPALAAYLGETSKS